MRFFDDYYEDPEAAELRAEARAERARNRPHWCDLCHGHTGPGSPCAPEEDEPEDEQEESSDEQEGQAG